MTRPLVSAIVPMKNAERYVGAALRSILGQKELPPDALEVLVVDNGSTDDSCEIVRRLADSRCRLLHEPRPGAAAARNLGIEQARGEFLAFLDADDLWTPGKLRLQLAAFDADPSLDLVFGHYVGIDADGLVASDATSAPAYSLCALLARRDRFMHVGLLSTDFRVGEFIDWYTRSEEAGLRHAVLGDVLLHRRVHGHNTTARTAGNRADYARIVRLAAARRGHLA
jgi:glycosyltransferase involved in cell wall biosynthesis